MTTIPVLLTLPFLLFAQEEPAEKEKEAEKKAENDDIEKKDGEDPEAPKEKGISSDREKRILELFTASRRSFENGKLVLEYNFESENQDLTDDWSPPLAQTKNRVRWARAGEGLATSIDDGIVIADFGEWIHKAVFVADLRVDIEIASVAQPRQGTILAPVFYNEKKKRALGVTGGYQAVVLSGGKSAKPPHPKTEKLIPSNLRHRVGYKFDGKVIESYTGDRKTSDTSDNPRFTEGFDSGRVGLAWSGSVQCFIFSVRMEGRLDPDWVAAQLGEKPGKNEKPGKKGSAPPKSGKK